MIMPSIISEPKEREEERNKSAQKPKKHIAR